MIKVKFNRNVYSDETIERTMKVYKKHAITTISYKKEYAIVCFWKCKYDEERTVSEFENYMIGVENT